MRTAFFLALLATAIVHHASAAQKPNVLLICVDDLKPLLGCYGNKLVHSPNIDALAARGLRFDAAYCNQAVCAPSRNALLTGLRPQTLGIYDLATNFRAARPDTVTLPQYFKMHGYRTEGLGKTFHVGHGNHDDPRSWSVPPWKAKVVGYALPESQAPQGLTREEALFSNVPSAAARQLPRGKAFESADVPDNAYADGQLADEAVRRLHQAASNADEPFFMAVGFVKPHLPFCAPSKYWDLYDRSAFAVAEVKHPPAGAPSFAPTTWGELRNYAGIPGQGELPDDLQRELIHGYHAAVSYMDAQVGRVIAALDDAHLASNTIVVFWGDHGWHLGDHGMWCKHTNYEQAAHIPLIVIAPGLTRPHTATRSLVESVDLYPTLCALAGLPMPEHLDGADAGAVLRDPAAPTKDAILHVFPRGERLGRAVRTARYRLVEWKPPGADASQAVFELYDYQADPQETKNLADEQPETVAQLRTLLAAQPEAKPQIKVNADQPRRRAVRKARRRQRAAAAEAKSPAARPEASTPSP
jgi:iduronate 2-sulfatase